MGGYDQRDFGGEGPVDLAVAQFAAFDKAYTGLAGFDDVLFDRNGPAAEFLSEEVNVRFADDLLKAVNSEVRHQFDIDPGEPGLPVLEIDALRKVVDQGFCNGFFVLQGPFRFFPVGYIPSEGHQVAIFSGINKTSLDLNRKTGAILPDPDTFELCHTLLHYLSDQLLNAVFIHQAFDIPDAQTL